RESDTSEQPCACYCFFFQAEDGIRDFHVTGVQTCALPIYSRPSRRTRRLLSGRARRGERAVQLAAVKEQFAVLNAVNPQLTPPRSEERRVGKECRSLRRRARQERGRESRNTQRLIAGSSRG